MSASVKNRSFLKDASHSVLESVQLLMNNDSKVVSKLFRTEYSRSISNIAAEHLSNLIVKPIREIADRGGKGWRAYLMISMCEALGKDAGVLKPWSGVIELLHVGSLIVDDIQDKSELRRGGISCHLLYGEPLALNAGNSAYFLIDQMVDDLPVSDTAKLKLYKTFFETMRAAHAGQALDINGLEVTARKAIESGSFDKLHELSVEIHRLKTGMPVTLCMLIGAIVADASEEQLAAITSFGEAVGIAFQVGDDIINLKGFEGNLKIKGEDIAHGKITFPMVVALENLPADEAKHLLSLILAKNDSEEHISYVLEKINSVDALQKSLDWSKKLLIESWNHLDPLIPESEAKNNLLQFGSFFLEKHY